MSYATGKSRLPYLEQLHGNEARTLGQNIADDDELVAGAGQVMFAHIFFRHLDGHIRIAGEFDLDRSHAPGKRELSLNLLARRKGENGRMFRAKVRGVSPHRAMPRKDDELG